MVSKLGAVLGDQPSGILDVVQRAERVSVVIDTVRDKRFQVNVNTLAHRTTRHSRVNLHPHRVDGDVAGEHHCLTRSKFRCGGVLCHRPTDEQVIRTCRSFKTFRQCQQRSAVCDHLQRGGHSSVFGMDLNQFRMCTFGTGTPKSCKHIIFGHIDTIVRIVKHIVFIHPTEEFVSSTDLHRGSKYHRVGAVSIDGRILHRRGSFTVHIIGDGKGLTGKVTKRYKRDVTIHTHVCTECGLRGIGVHYLPPHGVFVIRTRGDTLQSITRHQITIMHGKDIRGTISRGRLVYGNRIVRSNPFGIEENIGGGHVGGDVNGVTLTQLVHIPSSEREAFLTSRGI